MKMFGLHLMVYSLLMELMLSIIGEFLLVTM
nr:MAG TPA: hypothetical protein [Caudoviricetes sp.]